LLKEFCIFLGAKEALVGISEEKVSGSRGGGKCD